MLTGSPRAILLISCPDRKGLVARIPNFVFKNSVNILQANEHIDDEVGLFLMRIEWDLAGFNLARGSIQAALQPLARWVQTHPKRLCFPSVNPGVVQAEREKREAKSEATTAYPLKEGQVAVVAAERVAQGAPVLPRGKAASAAVGARVGPLRGFSSTPAAPFLTVRGLVQAASERPAIHPGSASTAAGLPHC